MKERRDISIDQAVKNGLQNHEAPFMDADWTAMEALLNEPKKPWIVLLLSAFITTDKLKNNTIMTTLFATTTLGVYLLLSSVNNLKTTNLSTKTDLNLANNSETTIYKSELSSNAPEHAEENKTIVYATSKGRNVEKKQAITRNPSEKDNISDLTTKTDGSIEGLPKSTAPSTFENTPATLPTDTPPIIAVVKKVKKTLVHEVWVEPVYESYRVKHTGDIDEFWIGMHYTQEGIDYSDSNKTHGFNLQFMSGNLIKTTPFALYGGLDWGMQFRNRTSRQEVILNTVNEDLGYTYLSSLSNDILLRGHLEFPKYRIVPYATFFAGPRIYSTGQKVGMYNPPVDTEGSTRDNIKSTALLVMGGGIGARVKLTDYASLDFRYEQIFGETKSVVDLTESRLVGTAYNLNLKNQATDFGQFKIGVIFDLSTSDYEKRIIKEGYTKEVTETYYIDPEDANKIIIPSKPCPQNSSTNRRYTEDEGTDWLPGSGGGSRGGGSGSSGGGKSSTPKIKAPVIRH